MTTAPATANATCPGCGRPVLNDPAGRTLEPQPDPTGLAIHLPNGTDLTVADVLAGRRGGHYQHQCPPRATTEIPGQEALL